MQTLLRHLNIATLLALTACGGSGGSANLTTETATTATTDSGSTGSDATDEAAADGSAAANSTDGILCDYDDTTFNSQPSLTYTSTARWSCDGGDRELVANGIPDHEVGTFPNPGNPNTISEQDVAATAPSSAPRRCRASTCSPPRPYAPCWPRAGSPNS